MREFSQKEKEIIQEKLINGSMLIDLLSDDFVNHARLEISVDSDNENHIFNYYSDSYDGTTATEELYDLVKLLAYLEDGDLVNKYHPPATSMSDFEIIDNITIGKSESKTRSRFIMPFGSSEPVVLYLYKNLYHTFRATETLKRLAKHNYKSIEVRQKSVANMIAAGSLFISAAAIIISIYQSVAVNHLESLLGEQGLKVQSLTLRLNTDSIQDAEGDRQASVVEHKIRLLETRIFQDSVDRSVSNRK